MSALTAAEIVALLNGVTRMGIAWQEYGAIIDRARIEGRAITLDDVADLSRRARIAIDGLHDAIAEAEARAANAPEPTPDTGPEPSREEPEP